MHSIHSAYTSWIIVQRYLKFIKFTKFSNLKNEEESS